MSSGVPANRSSSNRVFTTASADNEGGFSPVDQVLFASISLLWGASFLLIAEALEGFTPGMVAFGRIALGALALHALRLGSDADARIDRRDWPAVVLLGMVWVAIPFTLFPVAQQWINSAVTGLLNGSTPIVVAAVSTIFVRVVPRGRQIVGLVIGFVGIVLIALGAAGGGGSQTRGVILVLVATLCYGFAFNIAPPLQARYGAAVLMSAVLTVATVASLPYALVDLGANGPSPTAVAALLVLGVLGTGVAYWVMATLVGRVGSIRASAITYVMPVVSLGLGVSIRADDVTTLALIGAPLSIVGALLSARRPG